MGKMEELRERLLDEEWDIIGVVETWANANIVDAELELKGFDMFRKDRQDTRGGGLILYVRRELKPLEVDISSVFREQIWCTLQSKPKSLLVGLCYRPPNSSKEINNALLESIEQVITKKREHQLLLMGDFNYPAIDFNNYTVNASEDSDEYKFYDKLQDLYLVQMVTEPTRFRSNQTPSMLDYVITNEENVIDDMTYEVPLGKSDHICLTWKMTIEKEDESEHRQVKINYWKGNYNEIHDALSNTNWVDLLNGKAEVNDKWIAFKEVVLDLVEKWIPKKLISKRKKVKSKWITSETAKQMKHRAKLWRDYKRYPSDINYAQYKKTRNNVNHMVRRDQDIYRKQVLKSFKGNEKRFYGYIRQLQTRPCEVTNLIGESGLQTKNDSETAEVLSNYFQHVYTSEADTIRTRISGSAKQRIERKLLDTDINIRPDIVENALRKLKLDKSAGPDGFHPILLAKCSSGMSVPLSMIFQASLNSGKVPEDWKLANITPLFKKGKKNDPANYRPVSLTSVVCKVMERIIKDHLVDHIEKAKVMSSCQHGFTVGRSCLTNLLETFECWTTALDEGYGIDVLYLDYRKAFDTVSHEKLLVKLKEYGIDGMILKWIKDFLSSRRARVRVRGGFSSWFWVISGVPQGSVLGPLLFLLFVDDLPNWVKCQMKMFADDIKIWSIVKKASDSAFLQNDLDCLMNWSDEWLLRFNCEKCKVMHIGHDIETEYYMTTKDSRTKLIETKEEKDLGLTITNNLKPGLQCNRAAARAMCTLGIIKRHFKLLDKQDFLLLYKTYVRPQLEYCIQVWSPYLERDITCLENVQRRATKLVHEIRALSYEDRLKILGLTTLKRRRERGDLIETFKLLTGKEKIEYDQFFQLSETAHGLRGHSLKLFVKRSRLEIRRQFFSNRVVKGWNLLPQSVVEAPSTNAFKNRLDKYWNEGST